MNAENPDSAERPCLVSDGDEKPLFAAEVFGRELTRDDENVARRYAGNPWYRRRRTQSV